MRWTALSSLWTTGARLLHVCYLCKGIGHSILCNAVTYFWECFCCIVENIFVVELLFSKMSNEQFIDLIHWFLCSFQLFRLSGRLREIHTRKRDSQVVEYGIFAICSPASTTHSHHPASSIKKEVALTAQKRLERSNSEPVCVRYKACLVTECQFI